jgi:hypothetical protein
MAEKACHVFGSTTRFGLTQVLGGLIMFNARCILILFALATHTAACATEKTHIPSDPKSWGMTFLGLPPPSPRCPGGEISEFTALVPQLKPLTPKQYESQESGSLASLVGLEASDQVFPFYYQWNLKYGKFSAVSGFILARGACIIHVQATGYDN